VPFGYGSGSADPTPDPGVFLGDLPKDNQVYLLITLRSGSRRPQNKPATLLSGRQYNLLINFLWSELTCWPQRRHPGDSPQQQWPGQPEASAIKNPIKERKKILDPQTAFDAGYNRNYFRPKR
jgi:hypothetical protein